MSALTLVRSLAAAAALEFRALSVGSDTSARLYFYRAHLCVLLAALMQERFPHVPANASWHVVPDMTEAQRVSASLGSPTVPTYLPVQAVGHGDLGHCLELL